MARKMTKTILVRAAVLLGAAGLAACDLQPSTRVAVAPAPAKSTVTARASPAQEPIAVPSPAALSMPQDAMSDSVITARIKAGILSDPGMTGADVSVNTDRGVVSLTGTIKSQEQAAIASAHAQRQDGVMRVNTQLSITPQ